MASFGDKILASDINSIFMQLEKIRLEHLSYAGQSTSGKDALTEAFNTTPVTEDTKAEEPYTLLKQYLAVLDKSKFIIESGKTYADSIIIPSAGALIKYADLETNINIVNQVDEIQLQNSNNFSFRSSGGGGGGGDSGDSGDSAHNPTPFVNQSVFRPFFSSLR